MPTRRPPPLSGVGKTALTQPAVAWPAGAARKRRWSRARARGARLALLLALLSLGLVLAHEEPLFARVGTVPASPAPGEPFELHVRLSDISGNHASEARPVVVLRRSGSSDELEVDLRPAGPPGEYAATVGGLAAGEHELSLYDGADGEAGAVAEGLLVVGSERPVALELVLPSQEDEAGVGAWLIWLVGIPALAALLVLLLVLTAGKGDAAA